MGRVLKHNVALRQSLSGPVQTFSAGETLPDWAKDLVGDHLFIEGESEPDFRVVKPKTGLPSAPKVVEEEVSLDVPARSAAKAKWAKFLESAGIDFPTDASRDDLVDLAVKAMPDIEL